MSEDITSSSQDDYTEDFEDLNSTCKKDLDFWDILDINLQSGPRLEGHPASRQCQYELEQCNGFAVSPHLKPDSVAISYAVQCKPAVEQFCNVYLGLLSDFWREEC
ncbi:hypothetical protein Q9966_000657 [Columba livia]|nr:hypothetical protein Q9966_000657 [Columba livia]